MLNLAHVARVAKKAPSELLEITDELTAFEFDAACSLVYRQDETKRVAQRLNAQLKGIALLMGAKPEDFADDEPDDADVI